MTFTLSVEDSIAQVGSGTPFASRLAARRFFDPMAAAIIEQRRDLMWSKDNGRRINQILRAISHRPEGLFSNETTYLRLRTIIRRLDPMVEFGMNDEGQAEIVQALWDLAIQLEDGRLADARERLRRAQERLAEAMRDGASDEEIAELMQELREATNDYMRQLSRQAQENGESLDPNELPENTMQMTQNDLQRMMDRIQELMEQGRMAEAQQALEEFQRMMENMRVTQGQGVMPDGSSRFSLDGKPLPAWQAVQQSLVEALDAEFDPSVHEAVGQMPREGVEHGIVIEVVAEGFMFGDMVLRPSRVIISS